MIQLRSMIRLPRPGLAFTSRQSLLGGGAVVGAEYAVNLHRAEDGWKHGPKSVTARDFCRDRLARRDSLKWLHEGGLTRPHLCGGGVLV